MKVDNFKSWLDGVLEMNEEGWVPSKIQWKKILEKINSLEIDNSMVNSQPTSPGHYNNPIVQPSYNPPYSTDNINTRVPEFPIAVSSELPSITPVSTANGNYDTPFV